MAEPKKVILNVEPDKADEWDDYADEHYSSRSQLIRVAVAKEIADDNRTGEIPDDLTSQLSELTEGLRQITNRLDRMNERLTDLEQRVTQESSEIEELAGDVFEVLPTETELITETHDPVIPTENGTEIGHVKTGRVDHIATKLGGKRRAWEKHSKSYRLTRRSYTQNQSAAKRDTTRRCERWTHSLRSISAA